jgi:guanylate kinase
MSNIFIISAPSGCGKTSLVREISRAYDFMELIISCTTRNKRKGEINGKDYNFLTLDAFKNKISNGEFIEHEAVYGNYYGTTLSSIKDITDSGKDALLEIDYKGMFTIKKIIPTAISIYIVPPSLEELKNRLVIRGLDAKEVINNRISKAESELKYSKFSDFTIVNDDFDTALNSLKSLILHMKISQYIDINRLNSRLNLAR